MTVTIQWIGAMMGLSVMIPVSKKATGGIAPPPQDASPTYYIYGF